MSDSWQLTGVHTKKRRLLGSYAFFLCFLCLLHLVLGVCSSAEPAWHTEVRNDLVLFLLCNSVTLIIWQNFPEQYFKWLSCFSLSIGSADKQPQPFVSFHSSMRACVISLLCSLYVTVGWISLSGSLLKSNAEQQC